MLITRTALAPGAMWTQVQPARKTVATAAITEEASGTARME
jgi:hypothetical protein